MVEERSSERSDETPPSAVKILSDAGRLDVGDAKGFTDKAFRQLLRALVQRVERYGSKENEMHQCEARKYESSARTMRPLDFPSP